MNLSNAKIAAAFLLAAGLVQAAQPTPASPPDVCVAYPYYGAYTTRSEVSLAAARAAESAADLCVVYPYYGETTTESPASGALAETAEELRRVLAGYGRGQYLGL
jgi:hypothetical protein